MLSLLAHTVERVQIQLSIGPCHTNFCTSPHCSITVCYSLISLGSPILASSVDELLLFSLQVHNLAFPKLLGCMPHLLWHCLLNITLMVSPCSCTWNWRQTTQSRILILLQDESNAGTSDCLLPAGEVVFILSRFQTKFLDKRWDDKWLREGHLVGTNPLWPHSARDSPQAVSLGKTVRYLVKF